MVNETARGQLSQSSHDLLRHLSRKLPQERLNSAIRLFATNLQVDTYNMDMLLEVIYIWFNNA